MMKFNSTVLAITLFAYSVSALGMQQNQPIEPITPPAQQAPPVILPEQPAYQTEDSPGFWGTVVPFLNEARTGTKTFKTAVDKVDKVTDSINKFGDDVAKVGKGIDNVGDGFKDVAVSMKDASASVKEATADFTKATDKLTLEMDGLQKNGMKVSPETIAALNKTGVNLMKTYLTASIGGALALSGVILLYKTFMNQKDQGDQKPDLRPLYKQILTNRYAISALLIASGIGIILKSDRIVAAVA